MHDVWPVWKLALLLYIFVAAAAAINLFMLGLLSQAIGLAPLSPQQSMVFGALIGVPSAWMAGCWIRRLLDAASD